MSTQEILYMCFAVIILLQEIFNFYLTNQWNKVFESLAESAKTMIETHDKTKAMLDEQIKWNKDLERALEDHFDDSEKLKLYKSIYGEI